MERNRSERDDRRKPELHLGTIDEIDPPEERVVAIRTSEPRPTVRRLVLFSFVANAVRKAWEEIWDVLQR